MAIDPPSYAILEIPVDFGGICDIFDIGNEIETLVRNQIMKIKKYVSRLRRDFTAIYECEHCGDTHEGSGYDDRYFHDNVIPDMECSKCGKKADKDYMPLATKYPDGLTV